MPYTGIGPECGKVVDEEQAFDYALERCLYGTIQDQEDFREELVRWFYKTLVKNMLPDGSETLVDSVTMFQPGQVLIIGDAAPIPLKIQVELAKERPVSRTVYFWDSWKKEASRNVEEQVDRYLSQ